VMRLRKGESVTLFREFGQFIPPPPAHPTIMASGIAPPIETVDRDPLLERRRYR
jgi:hypothetical protein